MFLMRVQGKLFSFSTGVDLHIWMWAGIGGAVYNPQMWGKMGSPSGGDLGYNSVVLYTQTELQSK